MQEVRRVHGRRRIRLHTPRFVPGMRRVRLLSREREREAELEADERAVRIPRGEDAQTAHGPGGPGLQRLAYVARHVGRRGRVRYERRWLARLAADVGTRRERHA